MKKRKKQLFHGNACEIGQKVYFSWVESPFANNQTGDP